MALSVLRPTDSAIMQWLGVRRGSLSVTSSGRRSGACAGGVITNRGADGELGSILSVWLRSSRTCFSRIRTGKVEGQWLTVCGIRGTIVIPAREKADSEGLRRFES